MDRYLDPRSEGSPPALVVGTMNFGKRTPEPEAHRIVQRALERGLTFFDTANVYVDGESERILGRALGKRRPEARIATKVGIGGKSDSEGLAPERVTAALEESLRRLGTDRVELYSSTSRTIRAPTSRRCARWRSSSTRARSAPSAPP